MGYRNDIRVSTTTDGLERFMQLVTNKDMIVCMTIDDCSEDSLSVFGWDYVKWYDDCKDVREVMSALETLKNEGYPIEYARVGEEYDDVDQWESGDTEGLIHLGIRQEIYLW